MKSVVLSFIVAGVACSPASSVVGQDVKSPVKPNGRFYWIEAESSTKTNFPAAAQNPFAPVNPEETAVLSGGKWIGFTGKRSSPLFAEYSITVSEPGDYQVFARKFWKHGPYRWRFDNAAWQSVTGDVALLDEGSIRQFVGANWTPAGRATLTKGAHTLRIESTADDGAICFDAFVVTLDPFIPRGKMKPGEKYNRAPEGFFAFEPDPDPFQPTPLDMRGLNEKFAGQDGFIQAKGEEFVHAQSGKVERFWAMNTGHDALGLDDASLALFARSQAKQGVNMIRLHGPIWEGDWHSASKTKIRQIQRFVAAMKKEGIYTCLSIYFPLWLQIDGKNTFALLYFNPEFQKAYRSWWKDLLTTPDPTTGKSLREDPAVAIVELVNEDSYLFWTFNYDNIRPDQMAILERKFGDWLVTRYGSLNAAFKAWGGEPRPGDNAASGRAAFVPIWDMANVKGPRSQDTVAFFAGSQRKFYDSSADFLKKELQYRGLIYASNWITGDPRVLGPIDKWTNAGMDVMDRHGYFDKEHEGEAASYSVRAGHKFRDMSALTFPGNDFSLPIFDIRYDNKPSTITELNWTLPNRLRADLPVVAAAYGLLQGSDALYFFASSAPAWETTMAKFGIRTPVIGGQFPATAFLYRQGLVKPGPVAVEANLNLRRLLALEGAPITAPQNLDQLRAADVPGQMKKAEKLGGLDPLSFLVGKVAVNFRTEDSPSAGLNLGRYIDRGAKVVKSATGELTWDYGRGLVTVDAPQAQALTGYLSRGKLSTSVVEASSSLAYGSLVLVALDGKPIAESGRILLQVMSQEQPYGFETSGTDKLTITNVGSVPLVVKKLTGMVSLKRSDAASLRVTPLDVNGYPLTGAKSPGTGAKVELLESVFYYLIEK